MRVLNIHDYKEDKNNAAYKALKACDFEIISYQYDYDSLDPSPLFDLMNAHFNANFCDVVVGTGIGAFFAMLISAKQLFPCVLVNPIIVPGLCLPELGYHRYVGISGLRDLEFRYMPNFNINGVSTIVDVTDELMDVRMLNYTKEVLHNSRYYEITDSSEIPLCAMFKEHKQAWFDDVCKLDLCI